MDHRNSRKAANNRGWKVSDQKELSADTRIINALRGKAPQGMTSICEKANINKSTFYRYRHLLVGNGLMKEIDGKYALWDYEESPSLWSRKQQELQKAGGYLIKLKVEKLRLGSRDPKTGWCEKIFDTTILVQGVMILKGAIELEALARINFSGENVAALLTQDDVEEDDRLKWQDIGYVVTKVVKIIEGYNPSYRIAYLKYRPY